MDFTEDDILLQGLRQENSEESGFQEYSNEEWGINQGGLNTSYDYENDTLEFIPYSNRPETYIVPFVFAIIFVIGVVGNGTLIAIFIRHKTMFSIPNMYICSLAIGDILVILFCVPFTSTLYTLDSWPYGVVVCKFSEFIKDVSIGVSVFTLTALSADRYFAIADPMRKLTGRRATKFTCLAILGIWLLSVVTALPSVIFSYVRVIDSEPTKTFQICYPFPPELGPLYPKLWLLVKFLVYYAIPLFLIAMFYIIMARHLLISTRAIPGEAQGQAKQIQARKKVAKMVLSFVVIFAICFLPSHVFLLWFYFYPNAEYEYNEFWHVLRIVGFCLSFINSCINPITLYCVSGTFRKYFNQHLFCCCNHEDSAPRVRRRSHPPRGVLGCGCANLSSAGPVYGDRADYGDSSLRRNGPNRASTTNSARKWGNQSQVLLCNNAKSSQSTMTTTITSLRGNSLNNMRFSKPRTHDDSKCLGQRGVNGKVKNVSGRKEESHENGNEVILPLLENGVKHKINNNNGIPPPILEGKEWSVNNRQSPDETVTTFITIPNCVLPRIEPDAVTA